MRRYWLLRDGKRVLTPTEETQADKTMQFYREEFPEHRWTLEEDTSETIYIKAK